MKNPKTVVTPKNSWLICGNGFEGIDKNQIREELFITFLFGKINRKLFDSKNSTITEKSFTFVQSFKQYEYNPFCSIGLFPKIDFRKSVLAIAKQYCLGKILGKISRTTADEPFH